jgi:hypothetical protein
MASAFLQGREVLSDHLLHSLLGTPMGSSSVIQQESYTFSSRLEEQR